eukprot:XP_001699238.1 predicted protein [Chlamydomonas reinhardtii]
MHTGRAAAAPAAPASAAQPHQAVPHELPLFPVQPIGVFLPGMTKTLHLYEPHFIAMERMRIVRSRLLAMDTRDVAARLGLAAEAMAEARAALAARVALKEAAAFGQ